MNAYVAEFVGTAILLLLGNGVVCNVVLKGTKGNDSGWLVITAGWGFSVFVAVLCTAEFSGAHINPAVSVGLAAAGKFEWNLVPGYLVAQMLGAAAGTWLAFICYRSHYDLTEDPAAKRATFCTAPQIRSAPRNFFCEMVATFVLVYAVLLAAEPSFDLPGVDGPTHIQVGLGSLGALQVGLVVFAIGMTLGGPTGYAINPARDLAPRIMHAVLPVPGKGDSDWSYAAIPTFGPLAGGLLAALAFRLG